MKTTKIIMATVAAVTLGLSAPSYAEDFSSTQEEAIKGIIKSYIADNPEVLVDSLTKYQRKMAMEQEEKSKKAVAEVKDKLLAEKDASVVANPKGKVTVIEFIDYNCGYCKAMFKTMKKIVEENKDVKWVIKEMTMLDPDTSVFAAKASIAANMQGKLQAFHYAMMEYKGHHKNDDTIEIAEKAGVDIKKFKKDMESDAVKKKIEANAKIAGDISLRGVPAFIVGDKYIGGLVSEQEMLDAISAAKKPQAKNNKAKKIK